MDKPSYVLKYYREANEEKSLINGQQGQIQGGTLAKFFSDFDPFTWAKSENCEKILLKIIMLNMSLF